MSPEAWEFATNVVELLTAAVTLGAAITAVKCGRRRAATRRRRNR